MDAPLRSDVKTLINACQQFINIYLNNYICSVYVCESLNSTHCYISQSFSYQEKHVVRSFFIA